MNKDTCLTCVHWNLKNDKNKPHGMARHGFGYCDYDERYRYFSGQFACEKNKYESVDPDLKKRRIAWRVKEG